MKTNWKDKANEGAAQRAANEHHAHTRMMEQAAEGTKTGAFHYLRSLDPDATVTLPDNGEAPADPRLKRAIETIALSTCRDFAIRFNEWEWSVRDLLNQLTAEGRAE